MHGHVLVNHGQSINWNPSIEYRILFVVRHASIGQRARREWSWWRESTTDDASFTTGSSGVSIRKSFVVDWGFRGIVTNRRIIAVGMDCHQHGISCTYEWDESEMKNGDETVWTHPLGCALSLFQYSPLAVAFTTSLILSCIPFLCSAHKHVCDSLYPPNCFF